MSLPGSRPGPTRTARLRRSRISMSSSPTEPTAMVAETAMQRSPADP